MAANPQLRVLADAEQVAQAALAWMREAARTAIKVRKRFTLALAGGSTPKRLYERMAQDSDLAWDKVQFFFGDERHVPPDHPDSNFGMAQRALFGPAHVPAASIHRIEAERPAAEAAERYQAELQKVFGAAAAPPGLDLILLGVGPDAHTASLFPGTPAIHEARRWVMGQSVPKLNTERITFTPPLLNAAKAVMFLVVGQDKAQALKRILEGDEPVDAVPAKVVRPAGQLLWLTDSAAARTLSPATLRTYGG